MIAACSMDCRLHSCSVDRAVTVLRCVLLEKRRSALACAVFMVCMERHPHSSALASCCCCCCCVGRRWICWLLPVRSQKRAMLQPSAATPKHNYSPFRLVTRLSLGLVTSAAQKCVALQCASACFWERCRSSCVRRVWVLGSTGVMTGPDGCSALILKLSSVWVFVERLGLSRRMTVGG